MLSSTRFGISYPNPDRSDRPDPATHIGNVVAGLEAKVPRYDTGTNAARLAATHVAYRYWWTTDTLVMWWDDGTTWRPVGAGAELDYAQVTTDVTAAAASESTATTVVAGNSVTYDGTKVRVELRAAGLTSLGGTGVGRFVLLRDSTVLGQFAAPVVSGSAPVLFVAYDTPSAAAHVYTWKAWGTGTASFTVEAGAGGTGADLPISIRVTRA